MLLHSVVKIAALFVHILCVQSFIDFPTYVRHVAFAQCTDSRHYHISGNELVICQEAHMQAIREANFARKVFDSQSKTILF